jgi:hypothetical protein
VLLAFVLAEDETLLSTARIDISFEDLHQVEVAGSTFHSVERPAEPAS